MDDRAVRELRQLLTGLVIGLPGPAVLFLTVFSVPASVAAGVGVVLFLGAVWCTRQVAQLQRRRLAVPGSLYLPLPKGPLARARALVEDPATWRDLAWLSCQFVAGVAGVVIGVGLWLAAGECLLAPVLEMVGRSGPLAWLLMPLGGGLLVVAYQVPRHLLAAQTGLGRWLLAPTAAAQLAARVDRLIATRAAAVDATAVELRRVERDLHDGAQMRLAALSLHLGMAEDVLDTDPAEARALLVEARANAGTALSELRDLVRGIHPPVLAERGLVGAVRNLALASGIPVDVDLRLDGRLAASVESAAYFAIAESLANANRHSGAHRIGIAIAHDGAALHVTVRDDGHGGADPAAGSGLRGIQHRLSPLDGTLRITSPPTGPTVLEMQLPCGS
ncbi:MAG TPA: sensor domain-containing protein [Pseudonocardiaceae bacterium]|nr:sensor domain-containing protein [Pseudonocardiaceae bacterium]